MSAQFIFIWLIQSLDDALYFPVPVKVVSRFHCRALLKRPHSSLFFLMTEQSNYGDSACQSIDAVSI